MHACGCTMRWSVCAWTRLRLSSMWQWPQSVLRTCATRIAVKTGMYLSEKWRMFLHAADQTVFSCRQCLSSRSLHFLPYARTHTSRTHSHTTFCCQNKEETHAHTTRLYFMMAKIASTVPSHAHAILFASAKLTLGKNRRHSTDCV